MPGESGAMTSHPEAAVGCRSRSLIRPLVSLLLGADLAFLASWAPPAAAARELPSPAVPIAAGPSAPAGAGPRAAAPSSPTAGEGTASPADDARPAPGSGSDSTAEQGAGGAAAPPSAGSAAALAEGGVSAGMPVWRLFAVDAGAIFTAPAHWTARDWTVFGIGAASVVGLTFADKHLRTEALRGDAPLETRLANDFRYFGNYAAFSVLGAFYIGGRIGHDNRAQETALDGLIASVLAGGVITGVLKEVTGRYRPSTHRGVYSFKPFSGNASFPSGESTEAFAAGSVIATQYPNIWVEIACYGTASMVAFARMREDGHWASDVVAGALIGTVVGRAVVHLNRRLRARVSVAPLLAPGAQGLTIHTAF
jgi:membrane-associated phospholipid phosphatase